MSKGFTPSAATPAVITANDLRMGHCVWMRDGGWTADPREAELYEDEAVAEIALLEAIAQGRPNRASKEMACHILEVLDGIVESSATRQYHRLTSSFTAPERLTGDEEF